MRYNELPPTHHVRPGQVYYLSIKRRKALVHYHIVEEGETLYQIAQHYGMRTKSLRRKNRLDSNTVKLNKGMILWLRKRRPKTTPLRQIAFPKPTKPQYKRPEQPTPPAHTFEEMQQADEPVVADEPKELRAITSNYHTILPGETPYGIAALYGLALEDLLHWNGMKGGDTIHPGKRLRLVASHTKRPRRKKNKKKSPTSAKASAVHVVQSGESLSQIAQRYQVSLQDLLQWNGMEMKDALFTGKQLQLSPPKLSKAVKKAKKQITKTVKNTEKQVKEAEEQVKEVLKAAEKQTEKAKQALKTAEKQTKEVLKSVSKAIHTVQSGETLSQIAKRYGLSVDALIKYNAFDSDHIIRPADKIRLP